MKMLMWYKYMHCGASILDQNKFISMIEKHCYSGDSYFVYMKFLVFFTFCVTETIAGKNVTILRWHIMKSSYHENKWIRRKLPYDESV